MTTSIEHAFGSLTMVDGFLLNNQLTDFSFAAADAQGRPIMNRVQPRKRPRSSMAPTIVFDRDGNLEAVLGSPGGSSIIQYVTRSLIGLIDWHLSPHETVSLPHYGAKTSARTTLEVGTGVVKRQQDLIKMGHKIRVAPQTSGIHLLVFNGVRDNGQTGGLPMASNGAAGLVPLIRVGRAALPDVKATNHRTCCRVGGWGRLVPCYRSQFT